MKRFSEWCLSILGLLPEVYNEPVFPSVSQVEFEDGQQGGNPPKNKNLEHHKSLKGVLNQNSDDRRGKNHFFYYLYYNN